MSWQWQLEHGREEACVVGADHKSSEPFRCVKSFRDFIRVAVMLYLRCPLSLWNVEYLHVDRGHDLRHENLSALVESFFAWMGVVSGHYQPWASCAATRRSEGRKRVRSSPKVTSDACVPTLTAAITPVGVTTGTAIDRSPVSSSWSTMA